MFEVIPELLALMLLDPTVRAVARPVLSTDATAVSLDVQTMAPKVATVPSVMVPNGVNCCVFPNMMLADDGVMCNLANSGAVMLSDALFDVRLLAEAVMVVVP